MEQILNFLPLTEEERVAFEAAAPGVPQIFRPVESTRFVPAAPAEEYAAATVILGCAPVAAVAGAGRLKWLQTWSAGVDPYLKPGVLREGAALTSAVGAYGQAVSEHMFAMLLALCKRLHQYRDTQSRGCWAPLGEVRTLAGATVLVAGTGDIGSAFALLAKGMGAHTVGLRRTPSRAAMGVDEMYPLSALDQWLPRADVVALALPHSPETEHLMDRRRIQAMKRDAILLNAGRGTAVDCMALAEAMAEGHLWGAGLDVTDPEPLPEGHLLWRVENCLITPHVAGGDHLPVIRERVVQIALENLRRYLAGEALQNRMK